MRTLFVIALVLTCFARLSALSFSVKVDDGLARCSCEVARGLALASVGFKDAQGPMLQPAVNRLHLNPTLVITTANRPPKLQRRARNIVKRVY